jgi:hypothetical protein
MNTTRVALTPAIEKLMLDKWHQRVGEPDVYLTVWSYFALQGYDIQYYSNSHCFTIPESQLTFFLLTL